MHKIRQHQERSTAIKSLQQELVTLRSTVTSLKEKTRSPKAQTLAELTAERDEYLAEVMYLRDVLQEITAAEAERAEAMTTRSLVVTPVTGPPAVATVAEEEASTTPAAVVVPEVKPSELTGPATTTSMPNDVAPILSTSTALAEEGSAATTATSTTASPTNEEMERGILQPSPFLSSSSSLPSSSSSSRIPKYHSSSQSLPVRPQHMFRDSLVFFKPPHLEGTKLGSISEDENDREEGEGEAVKPVLLEEEEGQEEEEEGKKEGGTQVWLEEGVVTSNAEGLVMVKESEQEEEEREEEGACLSTCSLYLSQLSPLGQQAGQGVEEEEGKEVALEGSMQQAPGLMTTINIVPMEEVEEGKKGEEEQEKRQKKKEEGEQGGNAVEVPEL